MGFDQIVAQRCAERDRVVECGHAVWVGGAPFGRDGGVADAEPPGVAADLAGERAVRRGRAVGVTEGGPGGGVQEDGAVADRPGQGVLAGPAVDRVAVLRSERVAGSGRFQPEQATRRCRVADRAAEVVAVGHRYHPGGDRRGRAAAGSAGRPGRVPGIAGRAVQDRLTRWCHPELRGVRLAHDDQSRTPQPEDKLGVDVRDVAAQEAGSFAERDTRHLGDEVLDQVRNPGEPAGRWGHRRSSQRLLVHRRDDRVEDRVEVFDPLDRPPDQLGRGHLTAPYEFGLRHRV